MPTSYVSFTGRVFKREGDTLRPWRKEQWRLPQYWSLVPSHISLVFMSRQVHSIWVGFMIYQGFVCRDFAPYISLHVCMIMIVYVYVTTYLL